MGPGSQRRAGRFRDAEWLNGGRARAYGRILAVDFLCCWTTAVIAAVLWVVLRRGWRAPLSAAA